MPNVYIESLGCARNQVDSEIMATRLADAGWVVSDTPEDAEVIVVNTCSFIERAADESIDTILALADHKTTGRCRRLIVAGCLPERYRGETATALPEVDLFLGTGAYDQVVAAVAGTPPHGTCLLPDPDGIDVRTPVGRKPLNRHWAYLKVAEGCSRHCTFCIIPALRGRQKSRALDAIVEEARHLISGGVREITLVAQETAAYGADLPGGPGLPGLMQALARLDASVWVRFLYGHPQTVDAALLETIARHPNLCPYFDIPIQHASDSILRRMGRGYTADDMLRLFDTIRSKVPQAVLRTTVLVGFPGETGADVDLLARFMERVRFDHLGVFTYSDAEDLSSHGLSGPVPPHVAQARLDRLMAQQRALSEKVLAAYFGKRLTVLVEGEDEPGLYLARSMFQAPEVDGSVLIRSAVPLVAGTFERVTVVETHEYDMIAEPVR
jgi:ribosomal protein S12 methylthiotransferase